MDKIQKKLGKMHLPFFMDELVVSEMDLGTSMPELLGAGSPYLDDHGLWVRMRVRLNNERAICPHLIMIIVCKI